MTVRAFLPVRLSVLLGPLRVLRSNPEVTIHNLFSTGLRKVPRAPDRPISATETLFFADLHQALTFRVRRVSRCPGSRNRRINHAFFPSFFVALRARGGRAVVLVP